MVVWLVRVTNGGLVVFRWSFISATPTFQPTTTWWSLWRRIRRDLVCVERSFRLIILWVSVTVFWCGLAHDCLLNPRNVVSCLVCAGLLVPFAFLANGMKMWYWRTSPGVSPDSRGSVVQKNQEPREEPWSCGSRSSEFYAVGEFFSSYGCCCVDVRNSLSNISASRKHFRGTYAWMLNS